MMKTTYAALAIGLALATTATFAKEAPATGLAAACVKEAQAGNAAAWRLEPSLRPVIEDHRARMSAICGQLATASGAKTELLSDCLNEAGRGPRHIQRGRNMDRDHVARQKELCRKLAAS